MQAVGRDRLFRCESTNKKGEKRMSQQKDAVLKWLIGTLCGALLCGLMIIAPLHAQIHSDHQQQNSKLIEDVRSKLGQFVDVNNAGPAGYEPAFGCVSGPDHGAMGIHYVNGYLVKKNELSIEYPQALIYEPFGNKRQLVGVEYIVDMKKWLKDHDGATPSLDGQDFQLVGSPNRFNLDPFFELHVWAFRDNPQGAYVDWNNHVTCEGE
jgi:hypothetical protein